MDMRRESGWIYAFLHAEKIKRQRGIAHAVLNRYNKSNKDREGIGTERTFPDMEEENGINEGL